MKWRVTLEFVYPVCPDKKKKIRTVWFRASTANEAILNARTRVFGREGEIATIVKVEREGYTMTGKEFVEAWDDWQTIKAEGIEQRRIYEDAIESTTDLEKRRLYQKYLDSANRRIEMAIRNLRVLENSEVWTR